MTQDDKKRAVAGAAMEYIRDDMIVGVGTGSTVNCFIEELAAVKHRIEGAVASSEATLQRLKDRQIPLLDLNSVDELAVYVDGAFADCPVYDRATLAPGMTFRGPAIVEQADTTTVIEPDQSVHVDDTGNLVLRVG